MTALNGLILGQAALTSRAVFDRLLDRLGLTFEESVALRVAVGTGSVTVPTSGRCGSRRRSPRRPCPG